MIIMSYLDSCGHYVTIKGRNFENFISEIDAAKNTIPERILKIAKGLSEKEQQKF